VDWTFRLRDRRLRRWVAYGGRRFAYLPHSASLPRSLRSRLAYPRYALSARDSAHISRRMAQSPAATLRASVQDFNQPQLRLTARPTNLWSLFKWGFQCGLRYSQGLSFMGAFNMVFRYPPRLSIYGGFQCGVLRTSVSIYGGFLIRCSVSSRTCIVLVFYLHCSCIVYLVPFTPACSLFA